MKNAIRNISSEESCGATLCNGILNLTLENMVVHGGYAGVGTFRKYRAEHKAVCGATVKNMKIKNTVLACEDIVPVMLDNITVIE